MYARGYFVCSFVFVISYVKVSFFILGERRPQTDDDQFFFFYKLTLFSVGFRGFVPQVCKEELAKRYENIYD